MREGQRREVFDRVASEDLEFILLAPEQFNNPETLERLQSTKPSLFVVNEAHCISEWGHDFRPEYLRLGAVVDALAHPVVLALTATASPLVREEIVVRLHMQSLRVVVSGFDRPNIRLAVEHHHDDDAKREALLERARQAPKPGIIYTATRADAEGVARALAERGVSASAYHAGMKGKDRDAVQETFMSGGLEVVVATNAFGMGVDKPDVRFVFHLQPAESLDAYYQEIGRAGRDGKPAEAVLFYRPEDLGVRQFFAGTVKLQVEDVRRVAKAVADGDAPAEAEDIAERAGVAPAKTDAALQRLEESGTVDILPSGEAEAEGHAANATKAARDAVEAQERHERFERSRTDMMRGYAEVRDCRREYLLGFFGEAFQGPCGNCDNCEVGVGEDDNDVPFPLNSRVVHEQWGDGQVMQQRGDLLGILFESVGYKTVSAASAVERGLLRKSDSR